MNDSKFLESEELEQSLERLIDPWLAHMKWRTDFAEWRHKRLWQERYQSSALIDVLTYGVTPNPGSRVLDLGAGMGGFAVSFALQGLNGNQIELEGTAPKSQDGQSSNAQPIIAMDYNYNYCEITRLRASRYGIDLPTLVAAGENLPFPDNTFGILTCWDVVEHVQDPAKLFAEIARVLQPGGHAFVTVINRLALVDPHYHLRFVNWLPRIIGERYIAWRRRTKPSALQDRQRLREMHYYTFGAVVRLAARYGLYLEDLNIRTSRFKRLPPFLGMRIYALWRSFGMGTFRLLATKQKPLRAGTS